LTIGKLQKAYVCNLHVHLLHIACQAREPIRLSEHKGSAIRGALFEALRGPERPSAEGWSGFCANKAAPSCRECPVSAVCPVMRLVSTLDEAATYGHEAPRPYVINPPLDGQRGYSAGDRFAFDLLLVGDAASLFPYVVLALDRLEHEGLGGKVEQADGRYRRGRASILNIESVHPLRGERAPVLRQGSRSVQVPSLPITHGDVLAAAERLPASGSLRLRFLTPMRLIEQGQLLHEPRFGPLLQRLAERLRSLSQTFAGEPLPLDVRELRRLGDAVTLLQDGTRWLDLSGYSTRLGRSQRIGGLVGEATYGAEDWRPISPWLVWGTILHVGKNAVKGDGWFEIRP